MSTEVLGTLEQLEGDAVVEMLREESNVQKVASAEQREGADKLAPAANRLQSQQSKALVPTGRKISRDGSVGRGNVSSRNASRNSGKASRRSESADAIPHLPDIGSGRSTPSGPSGAPAGAPQAAPRRRTIPKPRTQSPNPVESEAANGGSPTAESSSSRTSNRRVSLGAYSRGNRAVAGSPRGATDADDGRKSPGADGGQGREGRVRGGRGDTESGTDVSPGRDPREAGWKSSPMSKVAGHQGAAVRRDVKLSSPSEEERRKRLEWVREKRRREEAKAREEAERRLAEENRRRDEEQARLEARRAAIRERIQKQHEVAAKMAQERAKADEAARGAIGRFLNSKPLHQKLKEEYDKQQAELEAEKKRQYDEELRTKQVRPRQIISGEVQIKPHNKPEAAAVDRGAAVRSPGHSRGSGGGAYTAATGSGGVASGGGSEGGGMAANPSNSSRGRVAARAPPPRAAEGVTSTSSSSPASAKPAVRGGSGSGGGASSSATAESGPPSRGQKPRVQGPTLTSTSSKVSRRVTNGLGSLARRGHLVDRASSPFVFTEGGDLVNAPPGKAVPNGSEVLQVGDMAVEQPSREVSTLELLVAATGGSAAAVAAGAGIAVAVTKESGEDSEVGRDRSPGGYTGDDDVPQMQSPLGLASGGAEAAYESEGAAEAEPARGTWGSDAVDTDVDSPGKGVAEAHVDSRYQASKTEDLLRLESRPAPELDPEEGQEAAEDGAVVAEGTPTAALAGAVPDTDSEPEQEPEALRQEAEKDLLVFTADDDEVAADDPKEERGIPEPTAAEAEAMEEAVEEVPPMLALEPVESDKSGGDDEPSTEAAEGQEGEGGRDGLK